MQWTTIPDILAVSLVVLVFLSIYRKRQSPCTWNWIAGWIFVDAHFLGQFLMPSHASFAASVVETFSISALVVSGVLFFLATIELSEDRRIQHILAVGVIVPFVCYVALTEFLPHPFLLGAAVALESVFLFGVWFFYFRGKAYAGGLFAISAFFSFWCMYSVVRGDFDVPIIVGLTAIYTFTALSYWRRFRRSSLGVVVAVVGFLAWGSVFTFGAVLDYFARDLISPASSLWNIPKYFVAGALILTLLEDEIVAAKRLMQRYRLQFDRSLCGVYRCTIGGEMLECNDAFVSMLQRSREEIFSSNVANLLGGDEGSGSIFMQRLARQQQVMGLEFTIPSATGASRYLIGNASLVTDSPGSSEIEGTILDISDFKSLQDQIRDSQKLEALGLLAGGVAHDFNNLLMVISGHMELLEARLSSDSQTQAAMQAVKNATKRGAAITGQLLAFSRKGPVEPKLLDMNAILEDARTLLQPVAGERILFEVKHGKESLDVMADENQIILVLLNLVINARDAMPSGGRVVLESSSVDLDESLASVQGLSAPGQYVCVSVSDSGCGMSQEIKGRVFEPFFTTKPQGKGTGLGLSICYGIIQQHNGNISITSSPEIGTTVSFYLPMVTVEACPAVDPRPASASVKHARILMVDDEEMLRKPACEFLTRSGFSVVEASSSDEALRIFDEQEFDLVITDMVMPGMNGKQLGEELKKRSPHLPVVYVSGYAQDILELHGQLAPGDILLQKPYSLKRLVRLVEEELEKRPNRSAKATYQP